MKPHIRIARPVGNLARSCDMYCHGLGLRVVGSFQNVTAPQTPAR
jgi:hypothetical protein